MKKIALGIALVMLLTMVFGVFASAVDVEDGKAVATLELFGLTEEDGNVTYTGTETGGYPDDEFGVAIRLTTGNAGFCYYKFTLTWDPTAIEYVECADIKEGDYLAIRTDDALLSGTFTLNDKDAAEGSFTLNRVNATNFATGGRTPAPIYDAICAYVYFKPVSDKAANTTINFTYTEVKNATPATIESEGKSITFKLNGGATERTEPLESLGAQVNPSKKAIRFGANFYNLKGKAAVEDLGMLVVSDFRLNGGDLDLDLVNEYVVKIQARGILNYVEGQKLEDYDYVNFVASITDIPDNHLEDDIVARPYVVYADEEVAYSEVIVKNYAEVLAENDN